MKSLPRIPSTGIGKLEGTTVRQISNPWCCLYGLRMVCNVPKEDTHPSVTPTIFILEDVLMRAYSLREERLIIEISAWVSTRNVVLLLHDRH